MTACFVTVLRVNRKKRIVWQIHKVLMGNDLNGVISDCDDVLITVTVCRISKIWR